MTPNGCSRFNGRCFDRLEWEAERQTVYAYFRDGSEYRFSGIDESEAILWINLLDSGCYFNAYIRPGDYVRLRGPD